MDEKWESFDDCNYEIFGVPSLNSGDKVEGILVRKNMGLDGVADVPWETYYEIVHNGFATLVYSHCNLDLQMTHVKEGDYVKVVYHGELEGGDGVYSVMRKKK